MIRHGLHRRSQARTPCEGGGPAAVAADSHGVRGVRHGNMMWRSLPRLGRVAPLLGSSP